MRIKSKAIQQGYHFDQGSYRDDMYVRCARCGFICNLDRDLRSHPGGYEGWGYNVVTTQPAITINYVIDENGHIVIDDLGNPLIDSVITPNQRTVVDPVVNAGCAQCGTLLYNNPARGTRG